MKNMKNNMKSKYILLVWSLLQEGIFAKKLRNFLGYSFFLQVLYK